MPHELVIHPTTLPSEAKYPVSEFEWGKIRGRKIGPPKIGPASNPVSFWGANLSVNCDLERLKKMVDIAANTINTRFSGYILSERGRYCYHISLLPRRIDENPEPLENFEKKYQALVTTSSNMQNSEKDFYWEMSKEEKGANPKVRTVMGLEEGYAEGLKRILIEKIKKGVFTSRDAVFQEIEQIFGEEERKKLLEVISHVVELNELPEALSSINLTVKHSLEEVQKLLSGSKWKVKEALIYSVFNSSIYSEPAVVITGDPQTEEIPLDFIRLGNEFRQQRFSLEFLDRGEAYNIEILKYDQKKRH